MINQPIDKENDIKVDKKKLKKWQKILLIILCVLLSFIILISGAVLVMWNTGKTKLLEDDVKIIPTENIETEVLDDNTVSYNDHIYKYNENITTVLCMGIDNKKFTGSDGKPIGHSGQADAIYLLVIDTKTGKTTVIALPRDSMADIELFSKNGDYIGTENKQLCLAYAYGNGKDTSCENTARAVSRLLCGMPVNSYFAIDYRSIETLHNAIGTITVTPNEDIKISEKSIGTYNFKKGVPVNLTGKMAFPYLQTRNTTSIDAAYLRMERQMDYLKKYSAAAIQKTKSDITFPVKLYKKVLDNSVTNIDASKVTYLATSVIRNSSNVSLEFAKLSGEYTQGENNYAELKLDENQIFDTVISIFYEEIK